MSGGAALVCRPERLHRHRPGGENLEELQAQLMGTQPVRCDEPQFSLFGVTLAGANLLASW